MLEQAAGVANTSGNDAINAVLSGGSVAATSTNKYANKTAAEICAEIAQSQYGMVFSGFNSVDGVNSLFPTNKGNDGTSLGGHASVNVNLDPN